MSGSELSYQCIILVLLNCLVCCICCGIYVDARDNYCCYIYAGVLALNFLVPWMFVKHQDLLSRRAKILHGALASVICDLLQL